jgi:hypothetical protein
VTGSIGDWYADREDSSFGDDADDERVEWHAHWDVDEATPPPAPAPTEATTPATARSTSSAVSEKDRQRILMAARLSPDDSPAQLVDVLAKTYTFVTRAQVIAVLRDGGIRRGERSVPTPGPGRVTPHPPPPAVQAALPRTPPARPQAAGTPPASRQIEHLRPLRKLPPLRAPRSPAPQPSSSPSTPRPQIRREVTPRAYVCPSCGTKLNASVRCACS